jgi:hypothetical protein
VPSRLKAEFSYPHIDEQLVNRLRKALVDAELQRAQLTVS